MSVCAMTCLVRIGERFNVIGVKTTGREPRRLTLARCIPGLFSALICLTLAEEAAGMPIRVAIASVASPGTSQRSVPREACYDSGLWKALFVVPRDQEESDVPEVLNVLTHNATEAQMLDGEQDKESGLQDSVHSVQGNGDWHTGLKLAIRPVHVMNALEGPTATIYLVGAIAITLVLGSFFIPGRV
ncbi:MAG: hypothetical protein KDA96_14000 [Planctomycetaceae bacterium]|nr:hypothetical protein [Planctomycetaceae bacterium]